MLKLNYDKKNDILYLSIGDPKPSYGEEDVPGIVIRRDMASNDITGITIFDFMKRITEKTIDSMDIPIQVDFQEISNIILQ